MVGDSGGGRLERLARGGEPAEGLPVDRRRRGDVERDFERDDGFESLDRVQSVEELEVAVSQGAVLLAYVDEAAGRDGERPEVRARNAARLSALAEASSEAAQNALREVVKTNAMDEPTRTLASTLAGATAAAIRTQKPASGRARRRSGWLRPAPQAPRAQPATKTPRPSALARACPRARPAG